MAETPEEADARLADVPMGVVPDWVWRAKRIEALIDGLARQRAAGRDIRSDYPARWTAELADHSRWCEAHERELTARAEVARAQRRG